MSTQTCYNGRQPFKVVHSFMLDLHRRCLQDKHNNNMLVIKQAHSSSFRVCTVLLDQHHSTEGFFFFFKKGKCIIPQKKGLISQYNPLPLCTRQTSNWVKPIRHVNTDSQVAGSVFVCDCTGKTGVCWYYDTTSTVMQLDCFLTLERGDSWPYQSRAAASVFMDISCQS